MQSLSMPLPLSSAELSNPAGAAGSVLLYEGKPSLTGVPDILAGLSPAEVARVVAAGRRVRFAPGDHLFRQGEEHKAIFVLRHGVVRSFYQAPSGREITLAQWSPGNFVGGPEIFGGGLHVWSGVAVSAGEAVRLPGPQVRRLMADLPAFAIGLVEGLAFKGKCYSTLLQMLGTRSSRERLAHLLLNLAELRGIAGDGRIIIANTPTHEQLATMIGATRQWVSMTLDRFRAHGLIEIHKRQLVIRQAAALRALADGDKPPSRQSAAGGAPD